MYNNGVFKSEWIEDISNVNSLMNLHRFPHGTISSVWCGVVRDIGDDWLLSIWVALVVGIICWWLFQKEIVMTSFLFLLIHAYMFLKPKC